MCSKRVKPDAPHHPAARRGWSIARRLTQSFMQVPHFPLTIDLEIDALLKARGEINKRLAGLWYVDALFSKRTRWLVSFLKHIA